MNIVFVGNFRPAASTENDLRWTLDDMGHTVVCYQEDTNTTDEIFEHALKAYMFLYVHTHGWVTPGSLPMAHVIRELKNKNIPTVAFHLDYWYGLARQTDVGRDDFWRCEFIFTADGDPRTQQWFEDKGYKHFWSPPAVVKRDCYLALPVKELKHDIVFVGSRAYHQEWPYREQLIHWLHDNYRDRFAHYGNDGIKTVRGHELNQLYASSKLAVGDSLCLGFDHVNYWSDRVYETRGRGGLLIHPEIKGLDKMLIKYPFEDWAELKRLIDKYLEDDELRERTRLAHHDYVKTHHTYHNRMKDILKIVETHRDNPNA